jgi:hypothetical protein
MKSPVLTSRRHFRLNAYMRCMCRLTRVFVAVKGRPPSAAAALSNPAPAASSAFPPPSVETVRRVELSGLSGSASMSAWLQHACGVICLKLRPGLGSQSRVTTNAQ